MARNQEKAQSMLYRFREAQRAELGLSTKDEKRPYLASLVDTIQDGEKWRYQIIKEVSNLVTKIQDRELGLETGENSAEAPDAGEQFSDTANAVFVDNCRLKADISLEMSPIYRQMEFLLRARSLDNEEARSYANDLLTLYLPSPAALGDFQIRDLNDQINKLLREKHHWERRILELGGPNYMGQSMRLIDEDGREVPGGQRGYRYFGRAKELPGVKELFEPEEPESKEKSRAELGKYIDADYYGYRDEEDGLLLEYEAKYEEAVHGRPKPATTMEPPSVARAKKRKVAADKSMDIDGETETAGQDAKAEEDRDEAHELYKAYVVHVPKVPTQEEVAEFLLKRRKELLLQRYLGPGASMEQEMQDATA